ncbi:MAG: aminodeoxychorismate/anthranilate synthase component II [Bacteroidia bacterium]
MILVIDNYDSFTWNLVDLIRRCHTNVKVVRNDAHSVEELVGLQPQGILISPGPGRPEDSGVSPALLRSVMGRIPVLGICLGHQLIGQQLGMELVHGAAPVHGKTYPIFHDGMGVFEGLPQPFQAMRYHSLVLEPRSDVDGFEITAKTASGEVMGIRHRGLLLEGVQFHPESILTEGGEVMIGNWIRTIG